jgi:hypothetical protein
VSSPPGDPDPRPANQRRTGTDAPPIPLSYNAGEKVATEDRWRHHLATGDFDAACLTLNNLLVALDAEQTDVAKPALWGSSGGGRSGGRSAGRRLRGRDVEGNAFSRGASRPSRSHQQQIKLRGNRSQPFVPVRARPGSWVKTVVTGPAKRARTEPRVSDLHLCRARGRIRTDDLTLTRRLL